LIKESEKVEDLEIEWVVLSACLFREHKPRVKEKMQTWAVWSLLGVPNSHAMYSLY
jgi:hypothetical protein